MGMLGEVGDLWKYVQAASLLNVTFIWNIYLNQGSRLLRCTVDRLSTWSLHVTISFLGITSYAQLS